MTAGPQERMVTGDGVDLAVTEWGDKSSGPTVVLVHGYPDTSAVWNLVAHRLAPRYHVVAYDVRGAGRSSAPGATEAYRLRHLVADLAAVAEAARPGQPVHLVGHDWGSIQGWDAVGRDELAGRFASFTSLYAPGLDHIGAWVGARMRRPTPEHVGQLLGQQMRSWYIAACHLPGAAGLWRAGLGTRWAGIQHRLEHVDPTDDYPAATIVEDGARGISLYRANFARHLARPEPRSTDVPVQVIVPIGDHYVSPALSEGLERWVPRLWRTEVVAGHWLPRTHPDLVARYVGELVDHVEGGPEAPRLHRSRVAPAPVTPTAGPAAHPSRGKGAQHRGRVVVVTGAGGGIGRATALAFARQGATIVAADLNPDRAAETAALAGALGVETHACPVDVADSEAMEALAKWVEHTLGGADIVVNNAGIGLAGPLLDTSVADWEHILGVNLWGVIHGSRLFGRQMAERLQGGHLVNVASAAAFQPSRTYPAYATTKSAVLMLTQCLRGELAGAGIGVHAICPGFVDTTLSVTTRHVGVSPGEQERRRQAVARMYRRRGLTADEVAAAVIKAVRRPHGHAVVPVGTDARFSRALNRWSPAAGRRVARIDFASHL